MYNDRLNLAVIQKRKGKKQRKDYIMCIRRPHKIVFIEKRKIFIKEKKLLKKQK